MYKRQVAIIGTTIFAGTDAIDIWKRQLPEIAVTTGISEKRYNELSFSVYPNPASEVVTLTMNKAFNEKVIMNIYNATGMLIKTETLLQNQQQINMGDLSNGLYIIEIRAKSWAGKQKLLIQK